MQLMFQQNKFLRISLKFEYPRDQERNTSPHMAIFSPSIIHFATRFDSVPLVSKNVLLVDRQMRGENASCISPPLLLLFPEKKRCSKRNPLFPVIEHRGRRPLLPSSILERSTRRLSREVSRTPLERDTNDKSGLAPR